MKYSEEIVKEIVAFVEEHGFVGYGVKLQTFCEHFKISDDTYYNWLKKPEFSGAIKKALENFKSNSKEKIFNKLLHKALGYDREFEEERIINSPKGKTTEIIKTKKHYPPDTGAAIFLLTNLDPENFKNRQTQDNNINLKEGSRIIVESQADADKLAKAIKESDAI